MNATTSRAEYDAALKRVRILRCRGARCVEVPRCACVEATLAALGLKEPPPELSERQWAASICCGGDPRNCDRYAVCPMRKFQKVEPPTETPKACPTCKGKGTIQPITETHRCRACKGTGIDGETPKHWPHEGDIR